jgi:hypothetical protein
MNDERNLRRVNAERQATKCKDEQRLRHTADQVFVKLVGLRAMRYAQIIHSRQIKQIMRGDVRCGWLLFPANHMREGSGWRHRRW